MHEHNARILRFFFCYSQGACISLYTAYNFKELLGGVLACSGILFPQGKIVGDKNKLKVFLAHGDKDESIPFLSNDEFGVTELLII